MVVDPTCDLVAIAKVNLVIIKGHACFAEHLANLRLPSLNLLLGVGMGTQHPVVPPVRDNLAHHLLDCAPLGQDIAACLGWEDLAGLELELAEPGGKEERTLRTRLPFDASARLLPVHTLLRRILALKIYAPRQGDARR